MSTPFQNRLVGTIIVAAVVIIFLPDVLDGEKQSHQTEFEAIPQADVFSGELTNKNFPEDKLLSKSVTSISNEQAIDEIVSKNITTIPKEEERKAKEKTIVQVVKAKTKPSLKALVQLNNKLPEKAIAKEAWVIHLGSFKDKGNVAQLLKKLKSKGYITFTKPIKTKQGTLTKVIIGPELIKSVMTKKLVGLKSLTGIQGKIASFEPNK